jgi:hypothetical protein
MQHRLLSASPARPRHPRPKCRSLRLAPGSRCGKHITCFEAFCKHFFAFRSSRSSGPLEDGPSASSSAYISLQWRKYPGKRLQFYARTLYTLSSQRLASSTTLLVPLHVGSGNTGWRSSLLRCVCFIYCVQKQVFGEHETSHINVYVLPLRCLAIVLKLGCVCDCSVYQRSRSIQQHRTGKEPSGDRMSSTNGRHLHLTDPCCGYCPFHPAETPCVNQHERVEWMLSHTEMRVLRQVHQAGRLGRLHGRQMPSMLVHKLDQGCSNSHCD